jgi:amino acid transporter
MFVRGGVYVVVRDAMGSFVARLSVSALLFDYVLTGPISSVSAGQYLGRLLNEASAALHSDFQIPPNVFAVGFAILVTVYFWWYNIKGLHESSTKALRIMQVTTVMVVMFLSGAPDPGCRTPRSCSDTGNLSSAKRVSAGFAAFWPTVDRA